MGPTSEVEETREELIGRLLAKADVDVKCSGGHCSGRFEDPPGATDEGERED